MSTAPDVEEPVGMESEELAGFEVETLTECPHLGHAAVHLPLPDERPLRCSSCDHNEEVWVCLTCGHCACGRHVKAHAEEHASAKDHPLAISMADMSAWCYSCEEYLNTFLIQRLHAPFTQLYRLKFGEDPALPVLRLEASGAGSSAPESEKL